MKYQITVVIWLSNTGFDTGTDIQLNQYKVVNMSKPNKLNRNLRFLASNLGPNDMENNKVKFAKAAKEHYFIQDSILW